MSSRALRSALPRLADAQLDGLIDALPPLNADMGEIEAAIRDLAERDDRVTARLRELLPQANAALDRLYAVDREIKASVVRATE